MRAALSTIQQTLTPDAATILNNSIAEAGRRNHGQTTPLHVAATLLSSPSGLLRQACIRSHPNSSHPLQCRALELCFSVALDRLPTAQNAPNEPPISNALLAALKRAQANQRRGCPEQQQQPLLAVKVELQQLIISILDDPSVSRVMREASFSSPAVKVIIEQSLNSSSSHVHHQLAIAGAGNPSLGSNFGGIGGRMLPVSTPPIQNPSLVANRNMHLNLRLQQGGTVQIGNHQKGEELKILMEIMVRSKKRNPILVGDSEPETVVKDFLRKIKNKELESEVLKNVEVVSVEMGLLSNPNQITTKMEELGELIESRLKNGGVILDLGDLKWLVEQPTNSIGLPQQKQQAILEMGKKVVVEMANLVARFNTPAGCGEDKKLWLIGTGTCETYLRCQVYHSTMENDWDLQAVPIASRSPLPGNFPRLGPEKLLSNPSLNSFSFKAVPASLPSLSRSLDLPETMPLCPKCSDNYEKELAKLAAIEKLFSDAKKESSRLSLPQWLQRAKLDDVDSKTMDEGKNQAQLSKHKTQELQKKWRDTCLHLHLNFNQNSHPGRTVPPSDLSMPSVNNSNLVSRPPFQPKLQVATKPLGEALKLNMCPVMDCQQTQHVESSPGSPVGTDLLLGRKETGDLAKDFLGCISSKGQVKLFEKFSDTDAYKKLLKALMDKAWWQAEAASAVASAITRCKFGNGKRRGTGSRGDVWLLFTGPDRVGKKKMALALAEQICELNPIMICLGKRRDDEQSEVMNFRGKTAIDRIVEAVRKNPFSVIMLEDMDEADLLSRGSVKRAMERGRLTDSHGREVGLGNAIFIITGDWSTVNPDSLRDGHFVDEKKLKCGGFQLGLIVREKSAKRKGNWLQEDCGPLKQVKETGVHLSLDLKLTAAYNEDQKIDGSNNSSDLTLDDEFGNPASRNFSITSVPRDLISNNDDSIVFKPVDATFVRREIKKTISMKFSMVMEEKLAIEVEDDVLDKILGGLWHDQIGLREWINKALRPSFDQLKTELLMGGSNRTNLVARLIVQSESVNRGKNEVSADWLPSSVLV